MMKYEYKKKKAILSLFDDSINIEMIKVRAILSYFSF